MASAFEKWKAAKKIVDNSCPSELRLEVIQAWAIQLVEKGISAGRDAALEEAAKLCNKLYRTEGIELADKIRELKEQK